MALRRFVEVGQTVTGWPQLASEVTLGAATVAAAVRRLGLKGELPSGRVRFDVEELLDDIAPLELPRRRGRLRPARARRATARERRSDHPHRRRGAAGALGREHPAMAIRGRRRGDPLLPDARTHTKMDVAHRAGYLGLGAALFNARVAAASVAKLGALRLFPSGTRSNHVATLELGTRPTSSSHRCSARSRRARRTAARARPRTSSPRSWPASRAASSARARACAW